ncbi:excinuclease ABC subunit UvrC [Alkalibacter rhizosphaerae]|nr:excinuclease ABC subunit UvrC [Alkalibacter rhizosphaerae]
MDKLKELPDKPGVYLMKDKKGDIIYVGKAKNLKNRVRQYFQSSANHGLKVQTMVRKIQDFEVIVTDTESEALILEFNLIKKHMPRYNIMLKDDKSYPYIKVTLQEDYPRVFMTRNVKKDGARYFGPYTSVATVRQTLDAIEEVYTLKQCSKKMDGKKINQRPCLNYFIGRCPGVCTGTVDKEEYRKKIDQIVDILKGKDKVLLENLSRAMEEASANLEFEQAAKYRDQIQGIKAIGEKQKITSESEHDQDVIHFAMDETDLCIQVFKIRSGKMLGRETHMLEFFQEGDDFLNQFVKQYYYNRTMIPREILLPYEIEDQESMEEWLKSKRGTRVSIMVPQKGDKKKLLNMVEENAKLVLFEHQNKRKRKVLNEVFCRDWLMEKLDLEESPNRIESFDISHLGGKDSVGAMVVFEDFKPLKKAYRRFRIQSVQGQDDYASTQEVVFRRMERGVKEEKEPNSKGSSFLPFPQVIMVDGGLGHVQSVQKILDLYDKNITVCGLVKNDRHRLEGLVTSKGTVEIPRGTPVYYLLNAISEEVHRFAVEYHRKRRDQGMQKSELSQVPGIGPARQRILLETFQSVEEIRSATVDRLASVPGIGVDVANKIVAYFHSTLEDEEEQREI